MPFFRRRIKPRLVDLTSLLRPWFLLPSMYSLLVGIFLALRRTDSSVGAATLLTALLIVGPLIAGSCIVFNQVADLPWDSRSPRKRKFPLVQMRFGLRRAYVLSCVLLAAGLALSFGLGLVFLVGAILASFLGFAYSHPSLRLKERPPLGCTVNGLCYGLIPVVLGWSLVAGLSWISFAMALPLFVIIASGYTLLGLPDIPGDASMGIRTLQVELGHRRTILVSTSLVGLSGLITFLLTLPGWYPTASLVVLPILVSIMAMHWRLLDRDKLDQAFQQLRYLYLVLGLIFLTSLMM